MKFELKVRHITWNYTKACNFRGIYCYSDASLPAEDELNTNEALKLIESVAELGAKSFVFSGGEPLLRKDLLKLIQYTRDLGIHSIL